MEASNTLGSTSLATTLATYLGHLFLRTVGKIAWVWVMIGSSCDPCGCSPPERCRSTETVREQMWTKQGALHGFRLGDPLIRRYVDRKDSIGG
jgi:hypothetical protein